MADLSTCLPLTRSSVVKARATIKGSVHHTPTITNATLDCLASTPQTPEALLSSTTTTGNGTAPASPAPSPPAAADDDDLDLTSADGFLPAHPKLRLWLKCENQQRVGAFKSRGAFHAISRLLQNPPPNWVPHEMGVITHSSGNHAQALALAAREHGLPAHIVMPAVSAPPKIAATRDTYGARVYFSGSTAPEREAMVAQIIAGQMGDGAGKGAVLVPPYDHPDIMLGQGTLGLELQEDVAGVMMTKASVAAKTGCGFGEADDDDDVKIKKVPGLDAILAPCGGGGMLSGVALSCEGTGIKVFGCEPSFQGADDARRGFYSGKRVPAVSTMTIADGLRTPLGQIPWKVIFEQGLVEGFYSVTEEQIKMALRLVLERTKMLVEPSAVVGVAVALYNEEFRAMVEREAGSRGWDVGVVLTGGNVGLDALGRMFATAEA